MSTELANDRTSTTVDETVIIRHYSAYNHRLFCLDCGSDKSVSGPAERAIQEANTHLATCYHAPCFNPSGELVGGILFGRCERCLDAI
jgi:hypothetical protein